MSRTQVNSSRLAGRAHRQLRTLHRWQQRGSWLVGIDQAGHFAGVSLEHRLGFTAFPGEIFRAPRSWLAYVPRAGRSSIGGSVW